MDKKTRDAIKIGLRQTIDAHGSINRKLVGSAIKRIEGQLRKKTEKIQKKLGPNGVGMS